VVKYGEKILCFLSSSIPIPLSSTIIKKQLLPSFNNILINGQSYLVQPVSNYLLNY
jgi:hypothetical protein